MSEKIKPEKFAVSIGYKIIPNDQLQQYLKQQQQQQELQIQEVQEEVKQNEEQKQQQ